MKNNTQILLFLVLLSNSIMANITLPNLFSDNMVLQRNVKIPVWGLAARLVRCNVFAEDTSVFGPR